MNDTAAAFGYPKTLVHAYEHWAVLLRPKQVTLGSLVLVCAEPVREFSRVSPEGMAELGRAIGDIERVLRAQFGYEKINYLMLMMVDPDVHFHVIPRYSSTQEFEGTTFVDEGWPGPPSLASGVELAGESGVALVEHLRDVWADVAD